MKYQKNKSQDLTNEIKKLHGELVVKINDHDYKYYVLAEPTISDSEYDLLMKELIKLEEEYPELSTPDSPTNRVGGEPTKEFTTVKHSIPMLSIEKANSYEDLIRFDKRIRGILETDNYQYYCELKIDGVSLSVKYTGGGFLLAVTRGDGEFGDDITANAKTIKSIPLKIRSNNKLILDFEVRGEVYISKKDFQEMNEELKLIGEKPFANPRNCAAGTLKLLDPKIVASRPLKVFIHSLIAENIQLQSESLNFLKNLNFAINSNSKICKNISEVFDFCENWKNKRDLLDYEIDGIVVKVDNLQQQEKLGLKSKYPVWANAFKFPPRIDKTKIKGITFQVGRQGTITPVAELEPIELYGSVISRATLYNEDFINMIDLHTNDTVLIAKGGDVIPKIIEVVKSDRKEDSIKFKFPKSCPACNSDLIKEQLNTNDRKEIAWRCANIALCPAQLIGRIELFSQRSALDIESLGGMVAENLIKNELIKNPLDLFDLKLNQLATLNLGTKEQKRILGKKNATKILNSLQKAKSLPLSKWIFALGIRDIGIDTAIKIAKLHNTFNDIVNSNLISGIVKLENLYVELYKYSPYSRINKIINDEEIKILKNKYNTIKEEINKLGGELENINAVKKSKSQQLKLTNINNNKNIKESNAVPKYIKFIGVESAKSVLEFFNSKVGKNFILRIKELHINPLGKNVLNETSNKLKGKIFVLTGTLKNLSREKVKNIIEDNGGKTNSIISKNVDYVVVGDNAGSKLNKAKELNIQTLNEEEFLKLI